MTFNVISGDSASASETVCDDWKVKLCDLISDYAPKNVFNMDETGVFYHALPDKTHCVKGEDCKGGKRSKDRLTTKSYTVDK